MRRRARGEDEMKHGRKGETKAHQQGQRHRRRQKALPLVHGTSRSTAVHHRNEGLAPAPVLKTGKTGQLAVSLVLPPTPRPRSTPTSLALQLQLRDEGDTDPNSRREVG